MISTNERNSYNLSEVSVLNLHGYNGSADNTNFYILSELPCIKVVSPLIDYESKSAQEVLDSLNSTLNELRQSSKFVIIVGNSFGAFFGKILSRIHNLPLVATNPCLRPDIYLRNIAPEYFNEGNSKYIDIQVLLNEADENYYNVFIVGDNDEVINHDSILDICATASVIKVTGGHSIDKKYYQNILKGKVIDAIHYLGG